VGAPTLALWDGRSRYRDVALIVLLGMATLGATCKKNPGHDPACGLQCQGATVMSCSKCVPALKTTQECDPADCPASGVCTIGACKESNGKFTCQEGTFVGSACNPDDADPFCPHDTYCKRGAGVCFGSVGDVTLGICSWGIEQYGKCDGNFNSPNACLRCIPGDTCIDGVCLKGCETKADCPCDKEDPDLGCQPLGGTVGGKQCLECKSVTENCDKLHPCCEPNTTCGVINSSLSRCCLVLGQKCNEDGQCCRPSQTCRPDSADVRTCQVCVERDESGCDNEGDCCHGSDVCDGGVCRHVCPSAGDPCTVDGCPGHDPKCDGACIKDDPACGTSSNECPNEGTSCGPSQVSGCQPGFKAQGIVVCKNGVEQCDFAKRFCAAGVGGGVGCGGSLTGGGFCGECGATPCTPGVTVCTPNAVCAGPGNPETCKKDMNCLNPDPICWLPSDIHVGANCYQGP
jgi:hypothetical protein